jgi:hypothetical protein
MAASGSLAALLAARAPSEPSAQRVRTSDPALQGRSARFSFLFCFSHAKRPSAAHARMRVTVCLGEAGAVGVMQAPREEAIGSWSCELMPTVSGVQLLNGSRSDRRHGDCRWSARLRDGGRLGRARCVPVVLQAPEDVSPRALRIQTWISFSREARASREAGALDAEGWARVTRNAPHATSSYRGGPALSRRRATNPP